jgi:hypothetical protein
MYDSLRGMLRKQDGWKDFESWVLLACSWSVACLVCLDYFIIRIRTEPLLSCSELADYNFYAVRPDFEEEKVDADERVSYVLHSEVEKYQGD